MIMRTGVMVAAVLAVGVVAGRGSSAANGGVSASDRHFMTEAANGGIAEVKKGKLATEKAANAAVKEFGQRMVADHTKANTELMALAKEKHVTLPKDVDSKQKKSISMMGAMNGAGFDRAYMEDMVKDHTEDVAAFQQEASDGMDPAVKAWAEKTLPTLQEHLKMARDTAAKVGAKGPQ